MSAGNTAVASVQVTSTANSTHEASIQTSKPNSVSNRMRREKMETSWVIACAASAVHGGDGIVYEIHYAAVREPALPLIEKIRFSAASD